MSGPNVPIMLLKISIASSQGVGVEVTMYTTMHSYHETFVIVGLTKLVYKPESHCLQSERC